MRLVPNASVRHPALTAVPQVWHYGLVSRWWAEFNTDGPEIAYFQRLIERYGQPALDVVCGGFALGGNRQQDQEALRRFCHHLEPDGALLLDNYLPYKDADEWRYWVKEERERLPEPWPENGRRKRAANGDEIELRSRLAAFDPLEQVATRPKVAGKTKQDQDILSRRR